MTPTLEQTCRMKSNRMSGFVGLPVQTGGINMGNVRADRRFLCMWLPACWGSPGWTHEELFFSQSFYSVAKEHLIVIDYILILMCDLVNFVNSTQESRQKKSSISLYVYIDINLKLQIILLSYVYLDFVFLHCYGLDRILFCFFMFPVV